MTNPEPPSSQQLSPAQAFQALTTKAQSLGFDRLGVLDVSQPHPALETAGEYLNEWLAADLNGSMTYMGVHGQKRWRPAELLPGTTRVISFRLHYLNAKPALHERLNDPNHAYISAYALGRDYHKTFRNKLKALQLWLTATLAPQLQPPDNQYCGRAFVDSAPVMEKATAAAAGLGWIGKNTLVIDKQAGSWFFLGELFTNIPLAPTLWTQEAPAPKNHCGSCTRCLEVCPTQAIIAPYQLDARRCISYLTIENKGTIPIEFRKAIGNRVFGCDDCQIFCPWTRFAKPTTESDFKPRHKLDTLTLIEALTWTAADFDLKTQGSPIRRTGYSGWLRNTAVAAGNALSSNPNQPLLVARLETLRTTYTADHSMPQADMVLEHVEWALAQVNPKN